MQLLNLILEVFTKGFQFLANSNFSFLILGFLTLALVFKNKDKIKFNILDWLFFLFVIVFFISLILRQAPLGFIEFSSLVSLYFLYKYFQVKPFSLPTWIKPSIILVNLLTITTFYFGDFDRLVGLTNFNQTFISYPNLWALVLGCFILLQSSSKFRLLNLSYLLSLSTAFFLTQSRTSIIILVLVCLIKILEAFVRSKASNFLAKFPKNFLKNLIIILLGLVIAASLINLKGTSTQALDRVKNNSISAQNSLQQRFSYFQESWEIFQDYPLFGAGPGGFEALQPSYSQSFYRLSNHPHNLELKLLSENGIFALILFIFTLVCILALNINKSFSPELLVFLFILGQSQFDYNLNFVISIIVLAYILSKISSLKLHSSPILKKALITLICLCLPLYSHSLIFATQAKHQGSDFYFLHTNHKPASKYPNYWKFHPLKVQSLSPFNNLNYHYQYLEFQESQTLPSSNQEDFLLINQYQSLLQDVIDKTKINYNFLVLSEQVPYALKISCLLQLESEFHQLKFAYLQELSKLDLQAVKNSYENYNCQ